MPEPAAQNPLVTTREDMQQALADALEPIAAQVYTRMQAAHPQLQVDDMGQVVPPAASEASGAPAPPPASTETAPSSEVDELRRQNALLLEMLKTSKDGGAFERRPNPAEVADERQTQRLSLEEKFRQVYAIEPQDVKSLVRDALQDSAKPFLAQQDAERRFYSTYPDARDTAREIPQFLAEHPDIAENLKVYWGAGDYYNGLRYAWLQMQMTGADKVTEQSKAQSVNESVLEEERDRSRRDAGLLRSTTERRAPRTGPEPLTQERYSELAQQVRNGYPTAFLRETLGTMVPDDLFS